MTESSKGCPKGPKGDKCRKRRAKQRKRRMYRYGAFAPMFYNNTGTPKSSALSGQGYDGDTAGGGSAVADGGGGGEMTASRDDVLGRIAEAMGLVEFMGTNHTAGGSGVTWSGYSVANPLQLKMRQGGPTIGGPGFRSDTGPVGGVVDPVKSPGLGFRSESAWRVWKSALVIMSKDKIIPKNQVFMAALARSGVRVSDLDPAESRLLEMGIEWYLSDPGSTSAKRGDGITGGDVVGADKYMGSGGAP